MCKRNKACILFVLCVVYFWDYNTYRGLHIQRGLMFWVYNHDKKLYKLFLLLLLERKLYKRGDILYFVIFCLNIKLKNIFPLFGPWGHRFLWLFIRLTCFLYNYRQKRRSSKKGTYLQFFDNY